MSFCKWILGVPDESFWVVSYHFMQTGQGRRECFIAISYTLWSVSSSAAAHLRWISLLFDYGWLASWRQLRGKAYIALTDNGKWDFETRTKALPVKEWKILLAHYPLISWTLFYTYTPSHLTRINSALAGFDSSKFRENDKKPWRVCRQEGAHGSRSKKEGYGNSKVCVGSDSPKFRPDWVWTREILRIHPSSVLHGLYSVHTLFFTCTPLAGSNTDRLRASGI